MPKLTPEELLKAIEETPDEPSADEDMESVLAMSDEQVMQELEAAGYTRPELDTKVAALLDHFAAPQSSPVPAAETGAKNPSKSVVSLPERTRAPRDRWYRRWGGAFAAAAAVELVGLGWTSGFFQEPVLVGSPRDESHLAQERIHEAAVACGAHSFARCLAALDEAEAVYPEVAKDPIVRGLREGAKAALGASGEAGAGRGD
jgi:hypothetical protein